MQSLRALFEGGWLALKMRERFAGEMERTGDQDRRRSRSRFFQSVAECSDDLTSYPAIDHHFGERLRIGCAFAANSWQQGVIGDPRERFANAGQIFVGENCEDERGGPIAKGLAPSVGENARGGWVMRAVDDCAFVPTLESRWPFNLGQAAFDCVVVDIDLGCAQRSDGERGIFFDHDFGFALLRRGNYRHTRFYDSGFFDGDLLERITQPLLMIEINRCDDGNIGLDGIGGVELPAEAGFQNDDVDLAVGEMLQRERGCDFEECRVRIPVSYDLANVG